MSKQPESTATSRSGAASTSTAASTLTAASTSISASNVASITSFFDTSAAIDTEKLVFMERFDSLDKNRFWVHATKAQAEEGQNGIALSVEEKVRGFVVDCTFIHPAFSFILDLSDETWLDVFTRAEIEELNRHGRAMLTDLEEEHWEIIELLANMTSPLEAYKFAQKMDYVPVAQPIIGWISLTIMSISRLCLCHVDIQKMKEADKLYLLWGFLCAVFQGTRISPIGYMSPNR